MNLFRRYKLGVVFSFVMFLICFGVELLMYLAEVGVGDVGVDLSGGDVGVAEHGLDGANVGAVHEEVGGEAVAEGVGGDVFCDAGFFGVELDDALD